MSSKEELENNVLKVRDFLKDLTPSIINFFFADFILPPGNFLFGEYLFKSWDRLFENGAKIKREYGIYFIFFKNKPLYVGKGLLPDRCFSHFTHTQYIDMLLAGHFGGIPRNPKLLEDDPNRQEKIKEALADFEIGFLITDLNKAKDIEGNFIKSLAPVANKEVYNFIKKRPYSIHKLIPCWPEMVEKEFQGSMLPDLDELKKHHEEKLKNPRTLLAK